MPGPASPLASAVSTMEDVSSTDVGYCSSSILGLAKMRFGSDERHDSRCFCFIVYLVVSILRDNVLSEWILVFGQRMGMGMRLAKYLCTTCASRVNS